MDEEIKFDFDIDKELKRTLKHEEIDTTTVKVIGKEKQMSLKIPKEYKEIMKISNNDKFEFQLTIKENGERELKGLLIKNEKK